MGIDWKPSKRSPLQIGGSMTIQYAVLPARSGRSYTGKLFTVATPDTEVTGNTITVTERTNAKGLFRASIDRTTALPEGDYILVLLQGTLGAAVGYFTFAGTDGETATETPPTVVLDPAARVKLDASQPDYAPATAAALAAIASTGTVNILSRVSGSTITTFMGDDHKVRSGTQIPISVSDPSGTLHAKWAVIGISNLAFGASRAGHPAGEIVGTIAAISYSANVTTVSIEISACGANLKPAEYTYQIQSTQTHTGEYDDTIEVAGLLRLERRTVAAVG